MKAAFSVTIILVLAAPSLAVALPACCSGLRIEYAGDLPPLRLNCTTLSGAREVQCAYVVEEGRVVLSINLSGHEVPGLPPRCVVAGCDACEPLVMEVLSAGRTITVSLPLLEGGDLHFLGEEVLGAHCVGWLNGSTIREAPKAEGLEFCVVCIEREGVFTAHRGRVCSRGTDKLLVRAWSPYSLLGLPLLPYLVVEVNASGGASVESLEGGLGPVDVSTKGPFRAEYGALDIALMLLSGRLALEYEFYGRLVKEKGEVCVLSLDSVRGSVSLTPYLLWFVAVLGACSLLAVGVARRRYIEELDLA